MQETGTISIHTENIFPIIKKFLYSDHEIFLRELVSNAVDATQKLKRLAALGEAGNENLDNLTIEISIDETNKTITVSDRGIGMTADEIKKYINQIAFSGATEFLEKYKNADDAKQIIGHFGLGFYSAFMVSDKVEIVTKSFIPGSESARWICDGSTQFEITSGNRTERGTDIILHLNKDSEEFLDKWKLEGILTKYCKFMPIAIKFGTTDEFVRDEKGEIEKDKEGNEKKITKDKIINETQPLWVRQPADLKDEDYKAFYKSLFPMGEEPLFHIHLNVDYPFNLTGILYFPRIKNNFENHRNKIQLYSRQVFITDEVKDVVPDFLQLLHGIIDSPDIPLNVSRSFLQADGNVKKITSHITKKVADKLSEIFKADRKAFEEKWDFIGIFVKYGMLSDDKFYEKAKEFALYKTTEGKYFTAEEYAKHTEALHKDKNGDLIWLYTSDAAKQDAFIASCKKRGYDVLLLDGPLDNHFANFIEGKLEKTRLKRVDSESVDKLVEKDSKPESVLTKDQEEKAKKIFEDAVNDKHKAVSLEPMDADEVPVTVLVPEFMRRMKEMQMMQGGADFWASMPDSYQLVVNANHPLTQKILNTDDSAEQQRLAKWGVNLGLLSQDLLTGAALTEFIKNSAELAAK